MSAADGEDEITVPIDTAAGRLVVRCFGPGPANVVLWSGLFFDERQHVPLARELRARGLSIAVVSPPGFGGSEAAPVVTVESCGEAIVEVTRRIGAAACFVGGTSWGGLAAIHGALRHPGFARGLVLFNTPIVGGSRHGAIRWLPLLARLLPARLFALGAAPSLLGKDNVARLRPAIARSMREAHRAPARRAAEAVLHHRPDLSDRLSELSVPVLVVVGDEDRAAPSTSLRAAWRDVARAALVEVKGTGHSSALEAPETVAAAVDAFVRAAASDSRGGADEQVVATPTVRGDTLFAGRTPT